MDAAPNAQPVSVDATPDVVDAAPPATTQYDFCDQPLFELPQDRESQHLVGWSLSEHGAAYSRGAPGLVTNLSQYVLDFETCTEYRISSRDGPYWGSVRDGELVVWAEHDIDADYLHDNRIMQMQWGSWETSVLHDSVFTHWPPRLLGHYVVFAESTTQWRWHSGNPEPALLYLLDLDNETQLILTEDVSISDYRLTDRYAVWLDCGSQGSAERVGCVGWRELETEQTGYLSDERVTGDLRAAGHHVTYLRSGEGGGAEMMVHDLETDTAQLVSDDAMTWIAPIDEGLVVYSTLTPDATEYPDAHFALYDVELGTRLRMTAYPVGNWTADDFRYPYLLLRVEYRQSGWAHYVANLEALGLVDADGQLVPAAEGALELPDEGYWP